MDKKKKKESFTGGEFLLNSLPLAELFNDCFVFWTVNRIYDGNGGGGHGD